MQTLSPRTMLKLDFIFAFSGAILYFFLFDFLQHTLGIPYRIVMVQLLANFGYGLFGIFILLGGQKRLRLFKGLVVMNFVYATLCLPLALYLLRLKAPLGATLLIAEASLIFLLAISEWGCLKKHAAIKV